jgi:AraC-like DNA-binding protein
MAVLQAMASEVYHAMGDYEKALPYIERAYEIDKQLGNEPRAMVRLAQKASVLVGKHEYKEAESTLKQVIPYLRQMQDRHSLGIALSKLGMAVLSQDREVEATPYFQEAIKIFQELGDPYNEVQAHRGLYECLWKHDPAEARRCLKRFSDLKDSLYNNMSAEALAKYNAEFGNDWLQIENKEERREKWWAIGLAVTVGIIGVCVWWLMRYRHKRQARINKELSEHIRELNRKYDILSEHYENAITTSAKRDESMELTTSDREFLERTVNTIYQLIQEGRPDAVHLAAQMGMSLYQLRQRLDSVTGEKPQDFIATVRMRRARHLLDTHPELNISEIATLCAYNDTPNFTRAFKKTFGLTPTNYLERQKDADTENK